MSVITDIYGKGKVEQFKGCVLNTWERNDSWDSDFYATVWDEELQKVIDVEYDTTRCGGGGRANIDATDEVLEKVYRYYYDECAEFIERCAIAQAKAYEKGDAVKVVRGRKVKVGTIGKCFWRGTTYNRYSRCNEKRMGIDVDGQKFFIAAENCVHANWEKRIPTDEEKEAMRKRWAANSMPHWAREKFGASVGRAGGFFAV